MSQGTDLKKKDELLQEIEDLRTRLSQLSSACCRINEKLDFDNVLCEELENARTLTDARYGVLTTFDDAGQIDEFLVSGMTEEKNQAVWEVPGGPEFFEYISQLPEPLRVQDFSLLVQSIGLSEFQAPVSAGAFLAAPIRYQGEVIGNIFLAKQEGALEFTRADEETLVMCASQAALVIANARRYREEKRARMDLETLINTSPVGVVVMDAKAGHPLSFNREAKRIVDNLGMPNEPLEQLLELVILRRADGREYSLSKIPLAQTLTSGETVRAEKVVLMVPDGRKVTTLVNSTPIYDEKGEIVTVVVTLQDMASVEELERLRAEFLGMVGHELRTPLTTIKGSAVTLMGDSTALDPAEVQQFLRIIDEQADRMRELISDLLDVARVESGMLMVDPEPAEVVRLVDAARNSLLNDGHSILIDLDPDLPQVMADKRRVIQVMNNLLSNAYKVSPESSMIEVTARQEDVYVAITVADEGRGIATEVLPRLFRKFSRVENRKGEREIVGSGLGLAICKGIVEAHGGRIWAESEGEGQGARFTFTLPVAEGFSAVPTAVLDELPVPSRLATKDQVRILAVDDDPQLLRYVRDILSKAGYIPVVTGDPEEVDRLITEHRPALILLDLMLPGADGIELMERLPQMANVPVIFLSGYGREQFVAKAFEKGAVDYVVKPFSPTELVARIQVALRRWLATDLMNTPETYVSGDLAINFTTRRVTVAGNPVQLTATEFNLLGELALHADRVLTHDQLLQRIWGPGNTGDSRLVRAFVKKIRRKIGDDARNPTFIRTVPRVGYRMDKAKEPDATP